MTLNWQARFRDSHTPSITLLNNFPYEIAQLGFLFPNALPLSSPPMHRLRDWSFLSGLALKQLPKDQIIVFGVYKLPV